MNHLPAGRGTPRPAPTRARRALVSAALAALFAALAFAPSAQEPEPPAAAPATGPAPALEPSTMTAELVPLATRALTLDLVDGANRAIAVGERGHILVSESRRDWRQVENVPTRSTLTAVAAVGDRAWAVGHDGVILGSTDGGLSWTRQRAEPYDPSSDSLHNGVPLLDVWFADEDNGFAVGAYALMLRTRDGGATWTQQDISGGGAADETEDDGEGEGEGAVAEDPATGEGVEGDDDSWTFSEDDLELEEESDPHLNGIARTGDGSLMIVAERGAAFRSTDGGDTWQRIALPYEGSMFGVIGYDGRHVLAFGLRGHAFESHDLGDNWTEVETGTELSLMGGAGWTGGGAALVGANGIVLTRSGANTGLLAHTHPDGAVLSSVLALGPGGELVVAGENGVSLFQPKSP